MLNDFLEVIQIKDLPVIGLLLGGYFVLGWFYSRSLKIVDELRKERENEREKHRKEIQDLNDKHVAKIEEMTEKLMDEIRKNGIAYERSTSALELILKSQRNG